jgi:ribonuclease HI
MEDGQKKMHWKSWDWLSTPKSLGGMGFRDMVLFNKAMLGRQAWRLLTDPSSLCARVLKGRYFPNCSFWEAPRPCSSSFTWRNILFGKEIVQQGLRWGIGNGQSTNILTDSWIPDLTPDRVSSLVPLPANAKVNILLNQEIGGWDADTIRSIFEEDIALKILRVPISRFGGEDFASWPYSRYGTYTVRSAYNMAREQSLLITSNYSGHGMSSDASGIVQMWKKLWRIKVPGKMKITLWRAAHDCLPSGHQLLRRHVRASGNCIFCHREERLEHTLLFCPYAREVWREVKTAYTVHLRRSQFTNIKVWLFDFLARADDREAVTLAVTVWHIWSARNAVRNGEPMKHTHSLSMQIKSYIEMILQHLFMPPTIHRRETPQAPVWSPPPEGMVVINVDAALFSSTSRMGVGVVIRDHNGKFLAACSQVLHEVTSPELAEALAVRRAVTLAGEEGLDRIILMSDCLTVIQRINSSGRDRSLVGVVVEDIKTLATSLSSVTFHHISRLCNNSAHLLARRAELCDSIFF